jgi:hemoglobin
MIFSGLAAKSIIARRPKSVNDVRRMGIFRYWSWQVWPWLLNWYLKYLFEARMATAARREDKVAAIMARTGIDERVIEEVVRSFYARLRKDALLGPVFDQRIDDWEPHLERMCAFWSSVALMSGRYHGRPMEKHQCLPVDCRHFDRWLALFEETVEGLCQPAAASRLTVRARQIAESLEIGVATAGGVLLARGQRLRRSDCEVFLPADTGG